MNTLNPTTLEDPLEHLTRSAIQDYRNGQIIYGYETPSKGIYLISGGHVRVERRTYGGRHVVLDVYQPDEFFGESALVLSAPGTEYAVAMGSTKLMMWTLATIQETASQQPMLALALMQLFIKRNMDFGCRIERFAVDPIDRRLAHCLIRFSERFGTPAEGGFVTMMPLTHELLAQYVGTSREIITHCMGIFRSRKCLRYSRRGICLNPDMLREWLRQDCKHDVAGKKAA